MNNEKQYNKTNTPRHLLFEQVGEKSLKQTNSSFICWNDVCDDLKYNKKSIMVMDTNGSLFNETVLERSQIGDVYLLDLYEGGEHSTTLNPLKDFTPGIKSLTQAKILANSLFELPKSVGADDHWSKKAREWATALLLYIYYCEEADNINLPHLCQLLTTGVSTTGVSGVRSPDGQGFDNLLINCPAILNAGQNPDNPLSAGQGEMVRNHIIETGKAIRSTGEREAVSIASIMTTTLSYLRAPVIKRVLTGGDFSLQRFVNTQAPQTLYIYAAPNQANLKFVKGIYRLLRSLLEDMALEDDLQKLDFDQKLIKINN